MTGNMIGKIFNNRYQITDRIGIGGMAEVYRAQDTVLGRIVAVKTMLPQYAADPTFTKRFRHEAASAANLQSPYIVNVYDWGQDGETNYIVMEYVRGSDLKTAINERGAINQRKVAEIGSQVCQALSAAHKLDIIHRDIKPQNIMVQPDGNVKVMDFGIARAKNSVMTQTSSVLGTAHYISPEQAQGKELTAASDMYSLGIVLYEAATGKLPFDGPDAVSVAMKQVNDYPIPPHQINPDIDPDLEAIIMKALEKNPQNRFATANDMRLALNDYLTGRPVALAGTFAGSETAVIGGMIGAGAAGLGAMAAGTGADVPGVGIANGTAVMPAVNKPVGQKPVQTNYRGSTNDNNGGVNKKTIAIIVGIVVVLLATAGIIFAVINAGSGAGEAVPSVTGKTVEEATKTLQDAGFELGKQDTTYSDTVEVGKIISQDPGANSRAEKGSKVNIVVSSGKEEVIVPDLTNKTAEEARKALEAVGLKANAGTAEYSETVEKNKVMGQNPGANAKAFKGDTVTYILSLGIENSTIPDVRGRTLQEATTILQDAGFKVASTEAFSADIAVGLVISQDPGNGFEGARGQTVTLTISKGPDPTATVPNVVGISLGNATRALEAAGFSFTTTEAFDAKIPAGDVISQSPNGGTKGGKGDTVTLTISKGPEPTPTPTPNP